MNVYDFESSKNETYSFNPVEGAKVKGDPVSLYTLSHILAVVEFFTVLLAAAVAKIIYLDLIAYYGVEFKAPFAPYLAAGAGVGLIVVYIFGRFGLYAPDRLMLRGIKMSQILVALSLSFMVLLSVLYAFQIGATYSRLWLFVWIVGSFATIVLVRSIFSLYIRALTAENRIRQKVAIFGAGELGHRVGSYLKERYSPTIEILGYFDEPTSGADKGSRQKGDVDGSLEELVEIAQRNQCDQIIIAMPPDQKVRVREIVGRLSILPVEVQYCPEILEMPFQVNGSRKLGDLHLLEVQHRPLSERSDMLKTAFDYVVGTLALLAFLPLMLLIAVAIKLDSPGRVLFVQNRHGYNHRIISVLKFRTMTSMDNGPVVEQAKKGDARITRVGAFLRKTSLDELPQLFNVLKGEMSLIGPRPHALAHNAQYEKLISGYSARHRVKPGLTGWAQINGYRGNTEDPEMMRRRIEYDLDYIANWSLLFDLKILLLTPFKGFVGQNAY